MSTRARCSELSARSPAPRRPCPPLLRAALLAALVPAAPGAALAQGAPASGNAARAPAQLAPVIVTANPLGSDLLELAAPASVLEGDRLLERRAPTLGATLEGEPGVASSGFAPGASRPVIRGLDGERVRILSNGVQALDASGASPDHAVALEPLLFDRVEVVRGPAAVLYGGSAVGGVVNVVDGRIPTEALRAGVGGQAEMRLGSNDRERAGVGRLDLGLAGGLNVHLNAFRRSTGDLRIPGFARSSRLRATSAAPGGVEASGVLPNSATEADGWSAGVSQTGARGYLGASVSQYSSLYGAVQEPEVKIRLDQTRLDLAGERRSVGPFEALRVRFGRTSYRHAEEDAGVAGTIFRNQGHDLRLEGVHAPIGGLRGVIGYQSTRFGFEAVGDEAFLPRTDNRNDALFVFEELRLGGLTLQAGGRLDRSRVAAFEDPRFGPAESRAFSGRSGSLGAVYGLSREYAIALNVSHTERAPNYQELYANGPHLATNAFEIGDRNLRTEKSNAIDLSLRKRAGWVTGSVGMFQNRFDRFVALLSDPTFVDPDPLRGLPGFRYTAVAAEFRGAEAAVNLALVERPWRLALDLRAETLRATQTDTGEPLPRIAPARYAAGLAWSQGATRARLDVIRAQAQDRVAAGELPTDGYTLVNATVGWRAKMPFGTADLFLRGVNLLDAEVRNHVSFLKDLAPAGRRGVLVGARAVF